MKIKPALQLILGLSLLLSGCASQPTTTVVPTETATTVILPTETATPTPIPLPMLYVGGPLNCTSGPGDQYTVVTTLDIGAPAQVIGKTSDGLYWVVKNPNGDGQCWAEAKYATIDGSTEMVAVNSNVPPITAPDAPKDFSGETLCSFSENGHYQTTLKANEFINLKWTAVVNATGYKIYRDDKAITTLPQNINEYSDPLPDLTIRQGAGNTRAEALGLISYSIEAFNDGGASTKVELPISGFCNSKAPLTPIALQSTATLLPAATTLVPTNPIFMATVNQATTCYRGPNKSYPSFINLDTGTKVEVIGKNNDDKYWIIKNPNGSGGCWLKSEYASIQGDENQLLVFSVPATPMPTRPNTPTNFKVPSIKCMSSGKSKWDIEITLSWDDLQNENNYVLFPEKNGGIALHYEVPQDYFVTDKTRGILLLQDSASYVDTLYSRAASASLKYFLIASNSAGDSELTVLTYTYKCPN